MFKLAMLYIMFSIVDLVLTVSIIITGNHHRTLDFDVEINPLARLVLMISGIEGLFLYKLFTVGLALVVVDILSRNDHKRHPFFSKWIKPEYILILGISLTAIAIILGLCYFGIYYAGLY